MKKQLLFIAAGFMLLLNTTNAQIKVYNGGYAAFGSTSTTPQKPIDVISAGGIRISRTDTGSNASNNELFFQDFGQIRSYDNNHRIMFDRSHNIIELREFGNIIFSPGSSGTRTQKVVFTSDGSVGIGVGNSPNWQTKVDVLYNNGSALSAGYIYCGRFVNANTISGTTNPYVYGVYGAATAVETNTVVYHYGVSAAASGASNNVGISAVASASSGAGLVYGGYFNGSRSGTSSANVYGIYATAPVAAASYAAWLNGTVYVNGSGTYTGTWTTSDQKFKRKIDTIANPMSILKSLKPKSYYYDTTNTIGMSFPSEKQYGFIAQDLQSVLPELVHTSVKPVEASLTGEIIHASVSHLSVNYNAFIALLTAAMQNQQKQLDSLKQALSVCCNANSGSNNRNSQTGFTTPSTTGTNTNGSNQSVNLSNANVVVLNQNVPNPFAEQTTISYSIPATAGQAQILFYDANGRQINNVSITTRGAGQLIVYANDLTNGIYTYTLVVDGQIIDTKKMIKQQ